MASFSQRNTDLLSRAERISLAMRKLIEQAVMYAVQGAQDTLKTYHPAGVIYVDVNGNKVCKARRIFLHS